MSWLNEPWLVVDTETTGLQDPKIVELGAVVMHRGEVLAHGARLFNPGRPIEPMASKTHGITDEMVALLPRLDTKDGWTRRLAGDVMLEQLEELADHHACSVIVAYNGLHFDLPLLRSELGGGWQVIEDESAVIADPLVLVRCDHVGRFWKGPGRHRLTSVAERLGLLQPVEGVSNLAHRATWDAVLAGRILWALRDELPLRARDEEHASEWFRARAAEQEAALAEWRASQAARP